MRQAKNPEVKFWSRFGPALAVLLLALLVQFGGAKAEKILEPFDALTAGVTAAFLRLSGMPVQREMAVLSHPAGFSYEIYYKCTGIVLVLFLSAALSALPGGGWKKKIKSVILGAVLLFALNYLRLTSLFYIGVYYPRAFDLFHYILWQIAMLGFVFGFWFLSMRRAKTL